MTAIRFNAPSDNFVLPSPKLQAYLFADPRRLYHAEGIKPGKEQIERFLGGLKALFGDVPQGDDLVVDNSTRTVARDSKSTMTAGRNFLSGMWGAREGAIVDRLGFRTRHITVVDSVGIIRDAEGQQAAMLQKDVTVSNRNRPRNYYAANSQAGFEQFSFQVPATVSELTIAIHAVEMVNSTRELLGPDLPRLDADNN